MLESVLEIYLKPLSSLKYCFWKTSRSRQGLRHIDTNETHWNSEGQMLIHRYEISSLVIFRLNLHKPS